jgi:hypothetical protein
MFAINPLKRKYDQISKCIEICLRHLENLASEDSEMSKNDKNDKNELYISRKRKWEHMIDNTCDVIIYRYDQNS